jgi:hypothetical protein
MSVHSWEVDQTATAITQTSSSSTMFQLKLFGNAIYDGGSYYLGFMPNVKAAVKYGNSVDLRKDENFEEFERMLRDALVDERKIHALLEVWMKYVSDAKPADEDLPAKESLIRKGDDCEGYSRIVDRYFYLNHIAYDGSSVSDCSAVVDLFYIPQLADPNSKANGWAHESKFFMKNGVLCTLDNWGLASHGTDDLKDVVHDFNSDVNYYEVYNGKWNPKTGELEYDQPSETKEIVEGVAKKRLQFEIDWAKIVWV